MKRATPGDRLRIGEECRAAVLAHLRSAYPEEGCGLLAIGADGETVTAHYPVPNVAPEPRFHYEGEPPAVLEALLAIERAGGRLGAVYHSHPAGPAYPSAEDVRLAFYPAALTLIVSLARPGREDWGLFAIRDGAIERRELMLGGDRE